MADSQISTVSDDIDRNLWESELELNITEALLRAEHPATISKWVADCTTRQVDVLCRAMQITGDKLKNRKATLAKCNGKLTPFYLIDVFAYRKGEFAVADFAKAKLPEEFITACRKEGDAFDKCALLYALYHANPTYLKMVFHLDKIHKSGFARMALTQKTRQPTQRFVDFLTTVKATEVLQALDRQKRDKRESQLKDIIQHHHHHLVFIRRPERPQYILQNNDIRHGHRVEWIILDFADNARRVNISSDSNEYPLQLANALASAYFGTDVQYDNECEVTYAKQIEHFFIQLKAATCPELKLTELYTHASPIDGVDLRLSHEDPAIVCRAVTTLERDYRNLTSRIDRIQHIKVIYRDKRIDIMFEPLAVNSDRFVMRYRDQRLNASERKLFEDYMRDTYAIPILSTEKRFAR